jgi:hypothetical protein
VIEIVAKPFAGQIERFVKATESIAVDLRIIAIASKQIATNTAVSAGTMDPPERPLRHPSARE